MNRPHQSGFTLIELIIFIVVVGTGLAGILMVMNTVVKASADPLIRKQTIAIAESLLEEILLREYSDSSRIPNLSCTSRNIRIDWVDVCDSIGYANIGIVNSVGDTVAGLAQYNIAPPVTVTSILLQGMTAYRVVVSVTGPGGTISLTGYRAMDTAP